MIELSRAVARRFRALLRKCVLATARRTTPPVLVRAGKSGLFLSCLPGEVGLRYFLPGKQAACVAALPSSVLESIAAGTTELVTIEPVDPRGGRARWQEGGVERVLEFESVEPESLPGFPEPGRNAVVMPEGFLPALSEAARTAARDVARLGLNSILLRGRDGCVIATDGRQLLLHEGFHFPWKESLLIPSLPAFATRELLAHKEVRLGRVGEGVLLEVGPWLLGLPIDRTSRYPDVDGVVPNKADTRLHLDAEDAESILGSCHHQDDTPIVLAVGTPSTLHPRTGEAPLVLTRSRAEGPAVRVTMDGRYLARALQLGFRTLDVAGSERPLVCRDGTRTYVWMPLDGQEATNPEPEQRRAAVPARNGSDDPQRDEATDLLAETEAVRGLLQEATGRLVRLAGALKQQRRQNRALRAALASLQRLKQLDP